MPMPGLHQGGTWFGRGSLNLLSGQRIALAATNDTNCQDLGILAAGQCETLTGHGAKLLVLSVAWSPDGQQIASASYDDTVKIWDLATKPVRDAHGPQSLSPVCSLVARWSAGRIGVVR